MTDKQLIRVLETALLLVARLTVCWGAFLIMVGLGVIES